MALLYAETINYRVKICQIVQHLNKPKSMGFLNVVKKQAKVFVLCRVQFWFLSGEMVRWFLLLQKFFSIFVASIGIVFFIVGKLTDFDFAFRSNLWYNCHQIRGGFPPSQSYN